MRGRPLQLTGYQASDYERPNDSWGCGHASTGDACPFGPTSKGSCGWTCTPRAVGTGVECGRPGAHKCAEGPVDRGGGQHACSQVACQPKPSLRRLRGLLSLGAVLLTLSILAAGLAYPPLRDRMTSPGPVSSKHAALSCSDCHAAAVSSESWTSLALKERSLSARVESQKCAECHKVQDPQFAIAHTLPAGEVAALQSDARGRWPADARPKVPALLKAARLLSSAYGERGPSGEYDAHAAIACATCHREHQGHDTPLTAVSEHHCQVCHTVGFDDYVTGHPEFTTFGKRQLASNGVFTHWKHYKLRFGETPPDCTSCHEPDQGGRHMIVKARTFETQCTRCHQHRANLEPLELLDAPAGESLSWFEDLSKRPGFEELPEVKTPAALELLLPNSDHKEAERALKILRKRYRSLIRKAPTDEDKDGAFSLKDGLKKSDLKKLQKAAKSAKLAKDYTDEIRAYVASLAKGDLGPVRKALALPEGESLSALAEVFPTQPLSEFEAAWWGKGRERKLSVGAAANLTGAWQGIGTWTAVPGEGLRYQGYGHLDPFLRAWLDLAPKLPEGPQRDRLFALFAERCGKCHVDPGQPIQRRVQWEAHESIPNANRRLTHFAHAPHLGLAESCTSCHTLKSEEPQRQAPEFTLSADWSRRGTPGVAGGCMDCHTPERYGASCQTCHDYHAGTAGPGAGAMPLRMRER